MMTIKIHDVTNGHTILIPEQFIVRLDDDFISIEIPGGFNWNHHARYTCKDCMAFFNSFGKVNYKWTLQDQVGTKLIDRNSFGNEADHFANLSKYEVSSKFYGSKLKLQLRAIEEPILEVNSILHADAEEYEYCSEIIKLIDTIERG